MRHHHSSTNLPTVANLRRSRRRLDRRRQRERRGQDHTALRSFVRDACEIGHAHAAATRAALARRTGASDHDLLLAALDLLRERDALDPQRARVAE